MYKSAAPPTPLPQPPTPSPPPPEEEEIVEHFECPNCGAPIEITPDTLVIVCKYCGYTEFRDPGYEVYALKALDKAEIERRFWERMRKDPDMAPHVGEIQIVDVTFIYTPFYLADYDAEWYYIGEKRKTEVHGSGKNARVVTKVIKVRGSGSESGRIAVPGRRYVEELGMRELGDAIEQVDEKALLPAKEYGWERYIEAVLGFDYEPREIPQIVKDVVAEDIKKRIYEEKNLTRMLAFLCRVRTKSVKAILAPIYVITYKLRRGIYGIAFSGFDGRQLVAMEPVFTKHMIQYTAGAAALASLSAAAAALAAVVHEIHILIVPILGLLGGFYLMHKAVGGVRFER